MDLLQAASSYLNDLERSFPETLKLLAFMYFVAHLFILFADIAERLKGAFIDIRAYLSEEHIPSKVDVTTVDITENGNHVDMQKDLRRIIHLSRTLATTDELKASQVASTSRLESMLQANIEELRQNQADSFKSIQETVDKTQAIVQDFIKSQADYFDSFQKTSEATRATIVHLEKVQVDSFQRIPQTSKESLDNISGLTSDIQAFRRDITEQLSGFRESVESTTKRLVHSQEKSQPVLQRLNVEFGHLDAVVRGIQTHVVQILGICQQDLAAKE